MINRTHATLLRTAGYTTGKVGKWQTVYLGNRIPYLPNSNGVLSRTDIPIIDLSRQGRNHLVVQLDTHWSLPG